MFRPLVRLALLILVVTAAPLLLLHLRNYDDSRIEHFFDASSCQGMPCWQGIRPDATTTTEALAILRAHPWVETVSVVTTDSGALLIYWAWSSRYPFPASAPQQGIIITDKGRVRQIYLTTGIPLGELWLALGGADGGAVDYVDDSLHLRTDDTVLFSHDGIAATATLVTDCSVLYPNFWQTPVYMWLQDSAAPGNSAVDYLVYLRVMRAGYRQVWASVC